MNLVDRLILVQQYIDDIKQHIRVVIDPDLIDLNIALFDRGDPRVQDVSYV